MKEPAVLNFSSFSSKTEHVPRGVYILPESQFIVTVLDKSIRVVDQYVYLMREPLVEDLQMIEYMINLGRNSVINQLRGILRVDT